MDEFFASTPVPPHYQEILKDLDAFVKVQVEKGRKIAVVTSGGTTVPLEKNTVRFLDNFSGGGRGSASAEYFIEHGYAVVFVYRRHSLQPYARHFLIRTENNFLDYLTFNPSTGAAEVISDYKDKVLHVMEKHNEAKEGQMLMKIIFQSIHEYLFLLRAVAQAVSKIGPKALIYSAAAVSDYYIPASSMAEHKIQSSQGPLTVHFEPVPKLIGVLSKEWVPEAYTVTFKLETNPEMLEKKARGSLANYQHQLVIANLLSNHKDAVVLYQYNAKAAPLKIERTEEEKEKDSDIEERLIREVTQLHDAFIESKKEENPRVK